MINSILPFVAGIITIGVIISSVYICIQILYTVIFVQMIKYISNLILVH